MCVICGRGDGEDWVLKYNGWRYKSWWSRKGDGTGCVGVIMKEACEAVKVRRVSDSDCSCVVFEEDVSRLTYVYIHR